MSITWGPQPAPKPNPYAEVARMNKVLAMLAITHKLGITAADVEAFSPDNWKLLEQSAELKTPAGADTRAMLLDQLRKSEAEPKGKSPFPRY